MTELVNSFVPCFKSVSICCY